MAYNSSYNPDALPVHAEPEQVAQMIGALEASKHQNQGHNQPRPQPPVSKPGSGPRPHRQTLSGPPQQPLHPPTGSPRKQSPHYGGFTPVSSTPSPQQNNQQNNQQHNQPNNQPHNQQYRFHSPPPQNYGFGPRPAQPIRNRPPPTGPGSTPAPPPLSVPNADDPQQLYPLFRVANVSNSGSLSEAELGSALVNGDYSSFDPDTVKMMVRMFDRDRDGAILFEEFVSLWRFLAAWRELFDRFDEDRSARISLAEFENAIVAFGYRLSPAFVRALFTTFESKGWRRLGPTHRGGGDGMSFDLFVQACITLKRITDVFKRYDDDRDGYITISFEEFLTEILHLQE